MTNRRRSTDRRQFLRYSAAVSGVFLSGKALAQTRPCPPVLSGSDSSTAGCRIDAENDWQSRIAGPGVMWAHDFRSDNEVTYWLWVNGVGDDPSRLTSAGRLVTWDTTDGITGGGCLKIIRRAGGSESGHWWRPMSPMRESGTGTPDRGWSSGMPTIDDPVDGNAMRIALWPYGNYGPASTGSWDGREFYLQLRIKLDSRRRDMGVSGGKIMYLTRTERSLTGQELVTYYKGSTKFSIYKAGSPEVPSNLPNVDHVWDQWVTYLYHVIPGDENTPNTTLEIWRALEGETTYTKIFETFDEPIDYQDVYGKAWNAVLISAYHNGIDMPEFWQKYDQIIFSLEFIPCPQS